MLPPGLRTPSEVVRYHDQVYFSLLDTHKAYPFLYPQATLGALLVILYLLIDHRKRRWLAWLRFQIFALMAVWHGWCILYCRARHPASAFGVGLISSWGTLWVASIMLWNDCQRDFKRIERSSPAGSGKERERAESKTVVNGSRAGNLSGWPPRQDSLRHRKPASADITDRAADESARRRGKLYWQSYPAVSLFARIDWIADVFCSFRGIGWNWQVSGIPPAPQWVEAQLKGEDALEPTKDTETDPQFTRSKTGIRRYANRRTLLKHSAISLAVGYMGLDLFKTLMHRDPYFWGYTDATAPAYLPATLRDSHTMIQTYRLLLSLFGIYMSLWTIFGLGPAFFCGVVGTKWIGVRGEPWMNPADMFGAYSTVFDKGLAGWWGGWWHQTFRFAFEAPTTLLLKTLRIEQRSTLGRAVGLLMAFGLSGCLHACGSYTQLGDTRPLAGPFKFFMLQAVGIFGQTLAVQALKQSGVVQKCPKNLCEATNFVFVHVWLYQTAPLLVDDFAKGGVWLYEPVAFSPLRGLGLGAPDDGFFCWGHRLVWWRTGNTWWDTGIAL